MRHLRDGVAVNRWRRRGSIIPTALSFAATAVVLAWIALHALYVGRHAGTPRRTLFAGLALAAAVIVIGVSAGVVARASSRQRRLTGLMRLGERVVGSFGAWLIGPDSDPATDRGQPLTLTFTNQRLLIHEPGPVDPPWRAFEHEEIVRVRNLGSVLCGHLSRCQVLRLEPADGRSLVLRMNAATALDFSAVRGQYLDPTLRQIRALVIAAEGHAPARPEQPLSAILTDDAPTTCLLELDEHYLRVTEERSAPLDDPHHCFHWEHVTVGDLGGGDASGCADTWRTLRLSLYDDGTLTVCGTEAAMTRLRTHALGHGARAV